MNNSGIKIPSVYSSPIGSGFQLGDFSAGGGILNSAETEIGNAANAVGGVLNAPGQSNSSGNLAAGSTSFTLPSSSPILNTGLKPNLGNVGNIGSNGTPATPTAPMHPTAVAAVNALTSLASGGVTTPQGGYAGNPSTNSNYAPPLQTAPPVANPTQAQTNASLPAQYANGASVSQTPPSSQSAPGTQPGLAGGQIEYSSTGQPFTGYNVSIPNQTNSDVMAGGLTYADALNARNQLMQDYLNKSNAYAQAQGQYLANGMKAQYSGDTVDYGTGAANLYKAEAQPALMTSQLEAGNALTALQAQQSQAQNLNPFQNQVSPGSTAYNPSTGQSVTSGMGAAPSVINSTAMQLAQMAQQQGVAQYNADGSLNLAPYIAQAQALYSPGGQLAGAAGANGTSASSNIASSGIQPIPPAVASYMQASGGTFINANKVPAGQQQIIQNQATAAGVPYLTGDEANKMQNINVTQSNLQQLSQVTSQILGSGIYGRTIGAAWNEISAGLQLNPTVASFNAYRTLAVNSIQALAGGSGSGFRLNQAEINTAQANLPTITDNLQTAQAKLGILNGFLTKWQSELLTGSPTGSGNSANSDASDNSSLGGGWSSLGD